MCSHQPWYAIYTRPRSEKKVAQTLLQSGFEAYCPVVAVQKTWGKRRSLIQEALFRPYVFVRVSEASKWKVLDVSGVLNYVHYLGKPARIREAEIEAIREFIAGNDNVRVEPIGPRRPMHLTMPGDPLSNATETVNVMCANAVEIRVESLGVKLVATVPAIHYEKKQTGSAS